MRGALGAGWRATRFRAGLSEGTGSGCRALSEWGAHLSVSGPNLSQRILVYTPASVARS